MLSAGVNTESYFFKEEKAVDDDTDSDQGSAGWFPQRPARFFLGLRRKLLRSLGIARRRYVENFRLRDEDSNSAASTESVSLERSGSLQEELERGRRELDDLPDCGRGFQPWPFRRCGQARRLTPALLRRQYACRMLLYEFIRDLVRASPNERPRPAEALSHKFLMRPCPSRRSA